MENAGIWMVADLRRSAEYWALRWIGQLLNHPWYLMYSFRIGQFGADWKIGSRLKIGVSPKLGARQTAVGIAVLRPQRRQREKVWQLGLVAEDWIGLALVVELVYTQCLWAIEQRSNCCAFLALLCRCRT